MGAFPPVPRSWHNQELRGAARRAAASHSLHGAGQSTGQVTASSAVSQTEKCLSPAAATRVPTARPRPPRLPVPLLGSTGWHRSARPHVQSLCTENASLVCVTNGFCSQWVNREEFWKLLPEGVCFACKVAQNELPELCPAPHRDVNKGPIKGAAALRRRPSAGSGAGRAERQLRGEGSGRWRAAGRLGGAGRNGAPAGARLLRGCCGTR